MSRRWLWAIAGLLVLATLAALSWLLANDVIAPLTGSATNDSAGSSIAGAPSSVELVEHPTQWDGERVAFTGEAVGQVMVRGRFAWVHVNDDSYAKRSAVAGGPLTGYNSGQAVWAPARLATKIETCGDYTHQGDVVRVEGVFHAACGQHGGDMDIHAGTLFIQRDGRTIGHPVHGTKVLALLALALLALILLWRELVRRPVPAGSRS